ncbi:MAG: glutamate-cysteine ligase family protein [Desulfuromonadales bacterium]|jgi:glutamate--cysteine ligase
MTTLVKTNLDFPIESRGDLVDYFARGARPPERWGIGVEVEKLIVDAETGEASSYPRIESLLQRLEATDGWQGLREQGHLIALMGEDSSITLEPGGQIELSGRLCPHVHCCDGDFSRHIAQIVAAAEPLGLAFLGLGVQPFTPLRHIDWVPKARYGIMGPYMLKTGDMGQRMMKQTAGVQVNIDFSDEADCIEKLRVAQLLSPILYALFANSPLLEGAPSGFLSTRGEIWSRTDAARSGLLPALFDPDAGYATYVEYALDVPMYFILRDGHFLNMTTEPFTFRRFLAEGFAGQRPTMEDWDLHLSTLFPEARLRPQIEVRCTDSLPPALSMGVAAMIKGIFYDGEALAATGALFARLDMAELSELYRQSWRLGLRTPFAGRTLREAALDVLAHARQGLARQGRKNALGQDETIYLDALTEIADSGVTLAERLLQNWRGSRQEKVAALTTHCGYR